MVEGLRQMIGNLIGQVGIDTGGCDATVSQYLLDDADIDAAFKEMGSKGMAQGMDRCSFGDTALTQGRLESTLHCGNVDRFVPFPGKEPLLCPGRAPECP